MKSCTWCCELSSLHPASIGQDLAVHMLLQAAVNAAQQSSKAAEEEKDILKQQLQQQQAANVAQQEAVAKLQLQLEQQIGRTGFRSRSTWVCMNYWPSTSSVY